MDLALTLVVPLLAYGLIAAARPGEQAWIAGLAVFAVVGVMWIFLNQEWPPFRVRSHHDFGPLILVVLATAAAVLGVLARMLRPLARRLGGWGYPALAILLPVAAAAALAMVLSP